MDVILYNKIAKAESKANDAYRAMYSEMDTEYTPIEFEVTENKFRRISDSFGFDWDKAKMSDKFPVTAGETIYVSATGWKYNDQDLQVAAVMFYKGTAGTVDYLSYDLLPTEGQKIYDKVPVVVPPNATHANVQGAKAAFLGCFRAHSAEDDLIDIPVTMTAGSFWHKDGRNQSWGNAKKSDLFAVTPGEKLYITAKPYGLGGIPGICYFSANEITAGNYLGYDMLPESDQVQYTNKEVIVPSGAYYALIEGMVDGTYGAKRQDLPIVDSNVYKLNKKVSGLKPIQAKLSIGGTVYAIVNDTIQLFYDSFIDSDVPADNLVMKFQCSKGKNYPRYWEFTPSVSDVGTHAITIELYNLSGDLLDSADVTLKVLSATNPGSAKNVLFVGDSLMQGEIPIETSRRFKGTAGIATSPEALSLTNINVVGRIQNQAGTVGWEGTGGWRYDDYTSEGKPAVRFTVSGITDAVVGAYYKVNNHTLQIAEVNVTSGSGNIRCMIIGESSISGTDQSGTLAKQTGSAGQDSISFTAWSAETYQPFWNENEDKFDISSYVTTYCGGQCDIVCILLGINGVSTLDTFADVSTIINDAKTLFSLIHTDLPNAKIIVSTMPLPSPLGGLGANNSASANNGNYNWHGYCHKVKEYNRLLLDLNDDSTFKTYVRVVNVHAQFDAYHGYPEGTKAINTRVSTTELVQTNGVHPRNEGYWQLADALGFRSILGVLAET